MKKLFFLLLVCFSFSQAQDLVKIDEAQINRKHGFITVDLNDQKYHYLEGVGWLENIDGFKLLLIDDEIYIKYSEQKAKVSNLRYGKLLSKRIVLDISGLEAADLRYLSSSGIVESDDVLEILLPKLDFDAALLKDFGPLNQDIEIRENNTVFKLFGSDFEYNIFSLSNPTRLVIDIKDVFIAIDKELRPGIIYKRFKSKSSKNESVVNLLEINPKVGHLEIVEAISEGKKLASLIANSFLGINAGYFDTSNYRHIGFLKIDGKLLALPSRNRASFGFDQNNIVIDRVFTEAKLIIGEKEYYVGLPGETADINLFIEAGSQVGNEEKTVILVQDGRVLSNSFGPQTVPENGFAVVYEPVIPDLLELGGGEKAGYNIDIFPEVFAEISNAIEAGPMLLKDFNDVYEPELEQFQIDSKILDSYTQQAAIGIKDNGNLIFIVADDMIARELIPVLEELNVKDAMRLDSGSSATLFADSKVLNRFFSRKIVTAIGFVLDK